MRVCRWIGIGVALAGAAIGAEGQELDRIAEGRDVVELRYPARAGVCGTGDGILIRRPDGRTSWYGGDRSWSRFPDDDVDPPCRTGDVYVRLERSGDQWQRVRLAVGRLPEATEAEPRRVTGAAAAAFFLDQLPETRDGAVHELMLAASLAEAETWPRLLELARDRTLRPRARKGAIHWLGREAAGEAAAALGGIVGDPTEEDEVREAAVFALSQLPDERAIPLLIRIARTTDDARVRSRALFWLAEFDDPRALSLFEEILTGGGS
jgi:hypothetical protein